jgi:hypothetical protein
LAGLASELPELTKYEIRGLVGCSHAGTQASSRIFIEVVSAGYVFGCDALLRMAVFQARRWLRECSSDRIRNAARERGDFVTWFAVAIQPSLKAVREMNTLAAA